jgi:hypothetical protein
MANNLAAFNSEAWSKRLVEKLNQVNVMLPLVNRNWEGDLRQNKTVNVRTLGSISMSTYTPNSTTISYQDLTPVKEEFTVSDSKYFAFDVDDVDKAQNDLSAMDGYLGRAVVAVNNTVESKLLATYSSAAVTLGAAPAGTGAVLTPVLTSGAVSSITITAAGTGYTTAPVIQIVGGDGTGATATCTVSAGAINAVTVTAGGTNYTVAPSALLTTATAIALDSSDTSNVGIYNVLVLARSVLSKQNVAPTPGTRWAVIDPDSTSLLLNDEKHFIRATNLGDNAVQMALLGGGEVAMVAKQMPGFIGQCAGFNVFECNHAPASGASKFLLCGTNDAISYASQITEMEMLRLQTSFADAARGLLLHDTFVPAESARRLVAIKAVRS